MAELLPLTFVQIVQQMVDQYVATLVAQGRASTDMDLLEGSQTRTLFEAVSGPIEELMVRYAIDLPARYYYDEAVGDALDRLILSITFGRVVRIPATTAAGTITMEGPSGTSAGANTFFVTPSGLRLKTTAAATIAVAQTSVVIPAAAFAPGTAGNFVGGTLLTPENPVAGMTNAYVTETWTGGTDRQSDEDYLAAFFDYIDSLTRGTRAAIRVGLLAAGYTRSFVQEPNTGRVRAYVDDGAPPNPVKIAAARSLLLSDWAADGTNVVVLPFVERPDTLHAEAFAGPGATKAENEASIAAAWTARYGGLLMGDDLTHLELLSDAAAVPGYGGVNLVEGDRTVRVATDDYRLQFSSGFLYPYERLTLAGIVWS